MCPRIYSVYFLVFNLIAPPSYAGELPLPLTSQKTSISAADKTIFIEADQIEGKKEEGVVAHGNVELQQGDKKVYADHLTYEQQSGDVTASGQVRVEQPSGKLFGPEVKINLENDHTEMTTPNFQFKETNARGSAKHMHSEKKMNYQFEQAVYTTCPADNDDWLLKMSRLEIDREAQIGTAYNAWVEFKGVPILYTPWMDFPLDGRRRSGFLGPVFGVTTSGGAEITLPYYWNIAPNYDATIAPRAIDKRGIQVNDEFRYLGKSYAGEVHYDVLNNDQFTGTTRTRASLKHSQNLGGGFGATLDLNRVSDDNYFRDLSTNVVSGTQNQLLNEGILSYGAGWWSALLKVQTFQTLQDPLAPVPIPYQRLPQLNVSAQKNSDNFAFNIVNEFVDFHHPTLINGQRLVTYPTITYAVLNDPGYYLKPKLGIHSTRYILHDHYAIYTDTTRTLPIFSLDSGITLERDFTFNNDAYLQTLEPRIFYVNIPYRDQSLLPNFDTSQAVFSFAQMFSENRFFGNDRVGDANMATVALTSRLIDSHSGAERFRLAIGERFSFDAPKVNLTTPDANNRSDILLAASGRATNSLSFDSLLQYNPNLSRTESYYATARYKPETGKVLNLGYRFTKGDIPQNDLRQIDASSQWPLFWRWHGVARVSYSLKTSQIAEGLVGLEYNQACWMLRLVAQQYQTATQQVSTGIFVQLELNDLMALGADPLNALRTSIPGYSKINEPSKR
ncbi:MAG: LPS-assembly protein LptD [Gallionellaceae bacterium]|jgi:LPS-assembly protein